jgi:peptide/nickel transport system substrate-binding protein
VKYSFDVMRDPDVNAQHLRGSFEDVESLEAPDPVTVVVRYRKPYWKGIYTVGFQLRILDKGWYDDQIPLWAKGLGLATFSITPGTPGFGAVFNKISVPCPGAGPYYCALDRYDKTDRIDLKQNPFYWGIQCKPTWHNFAGLRWLFIEDEVAAAEEFRKKTFDISSVDFQTYDDVLSKDPVITGLTKYFEYDHIGLGFSYIAWNCRRPPFDDARVRRAMTELLDRDWIVREIVRGRGQVATCPTKPAYSSYSKDIVPWPYDPEDAKKLLAEAGWRDTDGDGVLDRNGKRFEVELKLGGQSRSTAQIGSAFEDSCKKVGIRATPRTMEWATFIADFEERRFDAAFLSASFPDPWIDPYEDYHSSQDVPRGGNTSGWHSDRVDHLLEAMRLEFDDDKRDALWHELNHILHEEQPQTLIYHPLVGVLVAKRFEDVTVRPTGLQTVDLWVKPENVLHP